jgi:hypothetical protein
MRGEVSPDQLVALTVTALKTVLSHQAFMVAWQQAARRESSREPCGLGRWRWHRSIRYGHESLFQLSDRLIPNEVFPGQENPDRGA